MTQSLGTLVAVATYNEIENLPRLVEEIFRYAPDAEILIVDDNSPDATGQWCEAHAVTNPRLHVIHRPRKQGFGTAMLQAIDYASEQGYELLLTMDADFSHAPEDIPRLLERMRDPHADAVDLVIGSRYVQGGGIVGWPWLRHWMSRLVNLYARRWLSLTPRDCSAGFRCYRVAALQRVDLTRMRSQGYSFLEELLWLLEQNGVRPAEIPILYVNRRHGHSKIHFGEAWSALWILFRLGIEGRRTKDKGRKKKDEQH